MMPRDPAFSKMRWRGHRHAAAIKPALETLIRDAVADFELNTKAIFPDANRHLVILDLILADHAAVAPGIVIGPFSAPFEDLEVLAKKHKRLICRRPEGAVVVWPQDVPFWFECMIQGWTPLKP